MSSYGVGQGLERGVNLASQALFAGLGVQQRNRRHDLSQQQLNLNQQELNLKKRVFAFKAFGDDAVWNRLEQSSSANRWDPSQSPGALLAE